MAGATTDAKQAWHIRIRGQVQGVGFRPFVWQLARRLGLRGQVCNDAEGVLITCIGDDIEAFLSALRTEAPPLARIDAIEPRKAQIADLPEAFEIIASAGGAVRTRAAPDAATCADCLAEIRDADARRAGHAFANCTNCGPRFSILRALPYDRAQTSMAAFAMCTDCEAEYTDPADRRFHAQPIACPACGPRLWYEEAGAEHDGDAIAQAAKRLRQGAVLAIKGLGGFHLAVDALQERAIALLRARKHRPAKPLGLMGTRAMIRAHCHLSQAEEARLADPAAPILLLERRNDCLPDGLAPGLDCLGWMLPATPLHHLLLDACNGPLVMTSGNLSGEPMVIGNAEAREKLSGFADGFVMHDRDIIRRLDDSVEAITPHGPMVLRHARGRVPGTLLLPPGFEDTPPVLAMGGQMKAAICLTRDGAAMLSHHLGDLDDALTLTEYRRALTDYAALFDHMPARVAVDLHPEYRATREGHALGLPLVEVQHHHAHLAACLGENLWPRDSGPVAGIVLDGLGLGSDGTIWGGEVLLGDYAGFERVTHLAPAPLPGGEAAQREPWRNLMVRLDAAGLDGLADRLLSGQPIAALRHAVAAGLNAPHSTSVGRLFDAVAAGLGLAAARQSFEGEAAMQLEALARQSDEQTPWPMARAGGIIDPTPMFHAFAADLVVGLAPARMAARFHHGLAQAFCAEARALVETGAAQAVALSGGCFQNRLLREICLRELQGLQVMIHRHVPASDGGLALGQALVAAVTPCPKTARN